jgi:choline monooxygenase
MALLEPSELDALRRGYDPIPERSSSLPAECYRDPKYLAVEREAVFFSSWQFLCHGEKLRQPGSYLAGAIQGQSIFAVRDRGGQLRAFYNVCKHRGHELLKGEGQTALITCPYHAWAYGLDGALRTARLSEGLENFDKADFCLTPVQVEEFCGLVFVNLDAGAASLGQQSGKLAEEILSYAPDIGALTHGHRLTYRLEANWKTVLDNFLECYHCPVAHRDFCSLVEMETYKVVTQGIYSSHMAKAGRQDNSAYAVEDATVTDHAVWYLWPNTALLRYPGRSNFMVWQFVPLGPEETYEIFDFFFETATPSAAEAQAIAYIDEVLQPEDIALVESVQRGMRTPAFRQGRYVIDKNGSGMSEHAVHHFHGLLLEAYQKATAK